MDANNFYFGYLDRSNAYFRMGLMSGGVASKVVDWGFPGGASYKAGLSFTVTLTANATAIEGSVRPCGARCC